MKELLSGIIVGGLAGWIAEKIMHSNHSLLVNIIMGIIGGAVGGFVFGFLGINFSGIIGSVICGAIGACLLIFVGRKLFK